MDVHRSRALEESGDGAVGTPSNGKAAAAR
jgi:hypothetical protein